MLKKLYPRKWPKSMWYIPLAFLCINVFLFSLFLKKNMPTSLFRSSAKQATSNTAPTGFPELADLNGKNLTFDDLSTYFKKLADQKGGVYAFDVLKVAQLPPNTDLHLLGHVVGDELFKQKGAEGIKYCTQDFRDACSHTIVVGLFVRDGVKALKTVSDVCRHAPGGKGAYTMCFHGLGHGVLAYTDYDLEKAIKLCQRTGTPEYNNREYIECVGGATMEMMSGINDPVLWQIQSKKYFSTTDPLAPCSTTIYPPETKPICYSYLTPHLFEAAGMDPSNPDMASLQKAFHFCDAIPDSEGSDRSTCYGDFGKEFITLAQSRDIRHISDMTNEQLKKAYSWCSVAGDTNGIDACIRSSIQSLYWGGENKPDAAIRYCNIIPDTKGRQACYDELIGAVSYYIDDTHYKENFCNSIQPSFKTQCQKTLL